MAITGCTHRKVATFVFMAGNEPAGLWACADCGHKFVPLDIAVEKDAERYRKWRADYTAAASEPRLEKCLTEMLLALADAWTPDEVDAAIDAALAGGAGAQLQAV